MDLDHIDTAIASGGGYTLTTISELVHAHGDERAGKHIIANIQQHLADAGIHHLPVVLPADGSRLVLLYRYSGSPAVVALLAAERANAANDRGDAASADATIHGLSLVLPKKGWRAADEDGE